MPSNPQVPTPDDSPDGSWAGDVGFDLLVDGSKDFRSRADAHDIYEVLCLALQARHHPDHCDCDVVITGSLRE
jgi:hypothetical protein